MRAVVLAFAIVAVAGGIARADEVAFDNERERCQGPAALDDIVRCLKSFGDTAAIAARPSAHSALIGVAERRLYVQRIDGKWQMMLMLPPTQAVIGETAVTFGSSAALRFELRDQETYGGGGGAHRSLLRVKSAIVCGIAACQHLAYACSFVDNGRTTSMFAGAIVDDHGVARVEADRSRAVGICNR